MQAYKGENDRKNAQEWFLIYGGYQENLLGDNGNRSIA